MIHLATCPFCATSIAVHKEIEGFTQCNHLLIATICPDELSERPDDLRHYDGRRVFENWDDRELLAEWLESLEINVVLPQFVEYRECDVVIPPELFPYCASVFFTDDLDACRRAMCAWQTGRY